MLCVSPSLIRQYLFCPMAAYFIIAGIAEPPTERMRRGKEAQREAVEAAAKALGAEKIQHSAQLRGAGICGVVDAVLWINKRPAPLEVKYTTPPKKDAAKPQSPSRGLRHSRPSRLRQGGHRRVYLLRRGRRNTRRLPNQRPKRLSTTRHTTDTENRHGKTRPTAKPTTSKMPRMLVQKILRPHKRHHYRKNLKQAPYPLPQICKKTHTSIFPIPHSRFVYISAATTSHEYIRPSILFLRFLDKLRQDRSVAVLGLSILFLRFSLRSCTTCRQQCNASFNPLFEIHDDVVVFTTGLAEELTFNPLFEIHDI